MIAQDFVRARSYNFMTFNLNVCLLLSREPERRACLTPLPSTWCKHLPVECPRRQSVRCCCPTHGRQKFSANQLCARHYDFVPFAINCHFNVAMWICYGAIALRTVSCFAIKCSTGVVMLAVCCTGFQILYVAGELVYALLRTCYSSSIDIILRNIYKL